VESRLVFGQWFESLKKDEFYYSLKLGQMAKVFAKDAALTLTGERIGSPISMYEEREEKR